MSSKGEGEFQWTPLTIAQSIAIFCLAGLAEIFGGYLVWAAVKGLRVDKTSSTSDVDASSGSEPNVINNTSDEAGEEASGNLYDIVKKPWWYAIIGSFVLV